jgi:hypothetical protein
MEMYVASCGACGAGPRTATVEMYETRTTGPMKNPRLTSNSQPAPASKPKRESKPVTTSPALASMNSRPKGRTVRGSKRRPPVQLVFSEVGTSREGKTPSVTDTCSARGSKSCRPSRALPRKPAV